MYNRMLKLITEDKKKKPLLKRWKDIWDESIPKKDPKSDRRENSKRKEERGGDENNRDGDTPKDPIVQTGKNVAAAARGGGQTPGSKAVDWANKIVNRNKQIGPVMS